MLNLICIYFVAEGHCYMFGFNQFGQLGNSNHVNNRQPQLLGTLDGHNVTSVACGDIFTVAVVDGNYYFLFSESIRHWVIIAH